MQLRRVHFSLIAMAVLAGWLVVPQVAGAAKATGVSGRNQVLLAAASPFEDLTEFALAADTRGMQQALKAYGEQAAAVNKVLSAPARQEMASLLAAIRRAESKGANQEVALNSVEAYRVLVESLDPNGLVVPIPVAKLDYVGFRLKVLLAASPPDWAAIQTTSEAAGRYWHELEPQVSDKGLHDAVKTVIAGLSQATRGENPEMAAFAAQMDLALVDLLEGYFERARNSFRPHFQAGWLSRLRLSLPSCDHTVFICCRGGPCVRPRVGRPPGPHRRLQVSFLPGETCGEKACRYRVV